MDVKQSFWQGLSLFLGLAVNTSCSQQESTLHVRSGNTTGLDFSNDININKTFSILDYMYFFNGAGVAIGDINNDGLEDVFLSGNLVSSELYVNQGDLQFENFTRRAGLKTDVWCTGVLMEDFNQDGWLDIYVAVAGSPQKEKRNNLLFINNQDLTFTEQGEEYGLNFEDYTTHSAVLDYDQDGDLDIYLLNHTNQFNNVNDPVPRKVNGQAENTDRLLKCDWPDSLDHPVYTDVSMSAGITYEGFGLGVGISDVNNDGWPDIYVSNDFISNDLLYINQRDGTFSNQIAHAISHQSFNGMGNDLADINNDGWSDIMVVDMLPETRQRKMMMANNLTTNLQSISDMVGYERQFPRNTLQLNHGTINGAIKFSEIGQLLGIESTDWSWSPLIADLDLNGTKDIFITNGYFRDITDSDFIAYRRKRLIFNSKKKIDSTYLELVKNLPMVTLPNRVFMGGATLEFSSLTSNLPSTISTGAAYGDMDNDGDVDIITNNINRQADLLENQFAKEKNHIRIKLKGPSRNRRGIGSKVEVFHDGQYQAFEYYLSRGYMSTMGARLIVGTGGAKKIDSMVVHWSRDKKSTLYDFSVNSDYVIEYSNTISTSEPSFDSVQNKDTINQYDLPIHQDNKHIDFHHFRFLPWNYSNNGPAVAVSDINGDGINDFYVSGSKGYDGQLAVGSSDNFDLKPMVTNPNLEEVDAAFLDIDGDGDQDLYIVSGGSENYAVDSLYQDQLMINDGRGNFSRDKSRIPETKSAGSKALTIDFDNDGDMDLLRTGHVEMHQYGRAPSSYLFENDKGHFVDVTSTTAPELQNIGMITDGLVTDVDGDAWGDVVLVGEWMNIAICYNQKGKGFIVDELPKTSGIWRSVAAGDFDRDGDTDLIAGNLGLNSGLRASIDTPMTLISGYLDKNDSYDAIVSQFDLSHSGQEEAYPIYSRNDLISYMQPLQNQFPNFISYAKSTTNEIMQTLPGKVENELRCEILASIYLENKGNGKFESRELPQEFQYSTVQDILVEDFNSDGHLDFISGGNERGMNILIGDVDASFGLLALGKGDGTFDTSLSKKLGLKLAGEVRLMEPIKINQELHVLVGVNNDSMQILKTNPMFND